MLFKCQKDQRLVKMFKGEYRFFTGESSNHGVCVFDGSKVKVQGLKHLTDRIRFDWIRGLVSCRVRCSK